MQIERSKMKIATQAKAEKYMFTDDDQINYKWGSQLEQQQL